MNACSFLHVVSLIGLLIILGLSCIVATFLLLGLGILGGANIGTAEDSADLFIFSLYLHVLFLSSSSNTHGPILRFQHVYRHEEF